MKASRDQVTPNWPILAFALGFVLLWIGILVLSTGLIPRTWYDIAKDFQPIMGAVLTLTAASIGAYIAYRGALIAYSGVMERIEFERTAAAEDRLNLKLGAFVRLRAHVLRLRELAYEKGETIESSFEALMWAELPKPPNAFALRNFIEEFPNGAHVAEAEWKLAELQGRAAAGHAAETERDAECEVVHAKAHEIEWKAEFGFEEFEEFGELEKAWKKIDLFPWYAIFLIDRIRSIITKAREDVAQSLAQNKHGEVPIDFVRDCRKKHKAIEDWATQLLKLLTDKIFEMSDKIELPEGSPD